MTKPIQLISLAFTLCLAGCLSSGGRWSPSWDLSSDGQTVLYTFRGKILIHQITTRRDYPVDYGDFPIFMDGTKRIFYTGADQGIWLYDLARHLKQRVTSPGVGEADEQAAYEPISKRIYFGRLSSPASNGQFHGWDIYSCRLDGSDLIKCSSMNFWSLHLGPQSFCGGSLWFTGEIRQNSNEFQEKLFSMNLRPPHHLTCSSISHNAWSPAISPDGTKLAISEESPGGYFIQTYQFPSMIAAARSSEVGLVESPRFFGSGNEVGFFKETDDRIYGYRMRKDGTSEELFRSAR